MATRPPMPPHEWFHCYNRGVDKRKVFEGTKDYERFLALLYICNGNKNVQLGDLYNRNLKSVLADNKIDRGELLVEIGAYSLLPNHCHFIFKQIREGGIGLFMQKVFTGYTMYFNKKYGRTGALFAGSFKSKHIKDDLYLKQVVPYVLLNPIVIEEPRWKQGAASLLSIKTHILSYPYSSVPEFFGKDRLERKIIGNSLYEFYSPRPSVQKMLRTAQDFYREHSPKV
jgi:REP element-mobilizing transposase RayT